MSTQHQYHFNTLFQAIGQRLLTPCDVTVSNYFACHVPSSNADMMLNAYGEIVDYDNTYISTTFLDKQGDSNYFIIVGVGHSLLNSATNRDFVYNFSKDIEKGVYNEKADILTIYLSKGTSGILLSRRYFINNYGGWDEFKEIILSELFNSLDTYSIPSKCCAATFPQSIDNANYDALEYAANLKDLYWNISPAYVENTSYMSEPLGRNIILPSITLLDTITFSINTTEIPARLCIELAKLKTITIPAYVTNIHYKAFAFCSSLQTVKYDILRPAIYNNPRYAGLEVHFGEGVFAYTALKDIPVTNRFKYVNNVFAGCENTNLQIYNIPTFDGNDITTPTIKQDQFLLCIGVTPIKAHAKDNSYWHTAAYEKWSGYATSLDYEIVKE